MICNVCACNYVGIHGITLKWFNSYLADRIFVIKLVEYMSMSDPLKCGVPKGLLSVIFGYTGYSENMVCLC